MPSGIKNKIYEYLSQNKGKELTAEEIAKAIGVEKVAIVKAQLTRLVREGKVEKTAEGRYRAK
ncbi:HTH domain-containing protein [Pyrobaculum aerophilum]|uniref:TrmB family transcriptional regulator n=1 Tax=Pyrobaculum aerophilum TaxID=13773 RepID=A0A371R589_9CREN|nr:HTH domain-containing protein [Pyrobaculum aerophilum]RFA98535.1 TrmB family transcriptional regulator [Pyrobaculum aerophilum]RFA99238.1 TrmB family transcriptional regulator [Pyrobaculum aerophilum]